MNESSHWYTRDGKPAYTVTGKNGLERPTTLRDARKLGLVPSVTTIIKEASRPGLERWKLDQMLHAALTLPRQTDEKESDWISRVWEDSKETGKKAAERGVEIHGAIETHFKGLVPQMEYWNHVQSTVTALGGWWSGYTFTGWKAEESFAAKLGYGGKTDLHNEGHLADVKTKEFGPEDELKTWDEHHMQLAAYREGLGMPKARCAICYVSVNNPGLSRLIEIPEEDLERGWEMFLYLLGYWKAKNRFNSSWEAT